LEIKKKPVALHDDDENFEEDESQRVYAWYRRKNLKCLGF
jgi:hypothetical protein